MTLIAENVSCVRQERSLFFPLNFVLSEGNALWISGQNGIGKSSLLHLLATLSKPVTGKISWHAESIYSSSNYLNHLHYLGHTNGIKLNLSVMENIKLQFHLAEKNFNEKAARDLLGEFKLLHAENNAAHTLSAGQKRRLGLTKLWLLPKKIWILDEPVTALDNFMQDLFLKKLESHLENKGLAVLSSHQILTTNNLTALELIAC